MNYLKKNEAETPPGENKLNNIITSNPSRFAHNNNYTDPYHANKPIIANFNGFTGWKNNRNGAICERAGAVQFRNFKVADNLLAGIEFEFAHEFYGADYAGVFGALIVGKT